MLILEYTVPPVDSSPADGRTDGQAYTGEQCTASAEAEEAIPYISPVSPLYLPCNSPIAEAHPARVSEQREVLGGGAACLGLGFGLE